MKWLTILFILISFPVDAALVSKWSGAGPNACQDRCEEAWAESLLTEDESKELKAVQATNSKPEYIPVFDGQIFSLMTYYKGGKPIGYRTTTVAVVNYVTGSHGWQMKGWAFVKLEACKNWAIVRQDSGNIYISSIAPEPAREPHHPILASFTPTNTPLFSADPCCNATLITPILPLTLVTPIAAPPITFSTVPIPPSGTLLIMALCFVCFLKKTRVISKLRNV